MKDGGGKGKMIGGVARVPIFENTNKLRKKKGFKMKDRSAKKNM